MKLLWAPSILMEQIEPFLNSTIYLTLKKLKEALARALHFLTISTNTKRCLHYMIREICIIVDKTNEFNKISQKT